MPHSPGCCTHEWTASPWAAGPCPAWPLPRTAPRAAQGRLATRLLGLAEAPNNLRSATWRTPATPAPRLTPQMAHYSFTCVGPPCPPLWSPRRLPISNPLGALCSRTPPSSSALPTGRQTDMVEKIKVPAREPRALPRFLHMEKEGRGKKIFPAVAEHDARPNLRPSSAGPRPPQRATAPSQSHWSFPQVGPSQQLTAAGGREVMCGPGCVPRPDSGSALHLAASPASCPRTLPGPEPDAQPMGRGPASPHAPGRDG